MSNKTHEPDTLQAEVDRPYRLLNRDDLRARGIPFSRVHIHRLEKLGRFPRSVAVGQNRRAWLEHEIDAFIAARIAERDAEEAAA